jgi:amino acid transporter
MAKDKEMPNLLGLLHGEFATPHGAVFVLTIVSALFGIYAATPYNVDNITQITLASNTGTFLVYGMTCVVTIVAFAHRHDRHWFKHYAVPGLGALMNLAELFGVVYLAVEAGGNTATDAYKALAIVGAWIVAGLAWVALNPRMRGSKVLHDPGQKPVVPAMN